MKGDTVDGTEAKVEAALTSAQAQGIGGVAGVIEVSDSQSVIKLSASGTVLVRCRPTVLRVVSAVLRAA